MRGDVQVEVTIDVRREVEVRFEEKNYVWF